jgi:hypothetical protein
MSDFRPLLLIAGLAVLFWPGGGVDPTPGPDDAVSRAFDVLEGLWRTHASNAAVKLRTGELTTDAEARKYIADGQEPMRKVAFAEIAAAEQEQLGSDWTAEKHAAILEGYSR